MIPTPPSPTQASGYGPGGFGPPGGGPPPGGYGGPPGGGAPPGGYGGPPGGGPPPGGFGGPPGGFGGPPNPYGPPPNPYGGPPNPYGNPYGDPPMMPVQTRSGPNVGLIVGLGCGGLFLLAMIGGGAAMFLVRRPSPPTRPISSPTKPTTPSPTTPTGTLKGDLRDLRDFKAEFGKSRHFVGEIYNTGTDALGFPSAKVTLYDKSNTAIESSTCSTLVRVLPPGEKVPCTFSTLKADGFSTFKAEVSPMRSYFKGTIPDLKATEIKFIAKAGYNPNTLEGKITNLSSFKAKSVWAIVSLYGASGKICGADQALIAGTDLDPGQAGLFSAKIYNVAEKPETYSVKAIGYSE